MTHRMPSRWLPSKLQALTVGAAGVVLAGLVLPGAADAAAAMQRSQVTRSSNKYLLCLPAPDAPTPNRHYPFSFLLSKRLEHTSNRHIRTSVREIQAVLRNEYLPELSSPLAVDGSFGSQTRDAVKAFQRHNHLTVDGKVGSKTWNRLAGKCWKFH